MRIGQRNELMLARFDEFKQFLNHDHFLTYDSFELKNLLSIAEDISQPERVLTIFTKMHPKKYMLYCESLLKHIAKKTENFKVLCRLFLETYNPFMCIAANFLYFDHFIKILMHHFNNNPRYRLSEIRSTNFENFVIYKRYLPDDAVFKYVNEYLSEEKILLHQKYHYPVWSSVLREIHGYFGVRNKICQDVFLLTGRVIDVNTETEKLLDFVEKGNDYDFSVPNKSIDNKLIVLTRFMYLLIRRKFYSNSLDEQMIRKLIEVMESIIDYYMRHAGEFHSLVLDRILSLSSAKNSIKVRYNMDAKIWDMDEVLDIYWRELLFILSNRKLSTPINAIRVAVELGRLQNYYNYYKPGLTLSKYYTKELEKSNLSMANLLHYYEDRCTFQVSADMAQAFASIVHFFNKQEYDGDDQVADQACMDFIHNYENRFNTLHKIKIGLGHHKPMRNFIRPDFVYDFGDENEFDAVK